MVPLTNRLRRQHQWTVLFNANTKSNIHKEAKNSLNCDRGKLAIAYDALIWLRKTWDWINRRTVTCFSFKVLSMSFVILHCPCSSFLPSLPPPPSYSLFFTIPFLVFPPFHCSFLLDKRSLYICYWYSSCTSHWWRPLQSGRNIWRRSQIMASECFSLCIIKMPSHTEIFRIVSYCNLVGKIHFGFLLLGNGVCCEESSESFQVILSQLWVWIKWLETGH